jgi:4-diphosphocytidyl-2-C-methyl-D-erythritol kinase
MRLTALAPAKVNLSLFLGPLRPDGRHELVTLFESVSLADELILTTLGDGSDEVVCPGVEGENLVTHALEALRAKGWDAPPVRIEVIKRIPVAAGLGGGSADAAAALRLAVELAPGRPEEVAAIAAALGADVPSQLTPGLVLGTGAGDVVEPFDPIVEHALVLVPQPIALSTADVYAEADRLGLPRAAEDLAARYRDLCATLRPGIRLPDELVINDLQPASLSLCPAIDEALAGARDCGADQVLVCGSGPTVAGLFWGEGANAAADALGSRFPGTVVVEPVESGFGTPVPA